jgi:hypothetical protein
MVRYCFSCVLVLVVLSSATIVCAQAKPKVSFSLTQVPDQWAQVRGVPEVIASQKCENWAWAANVEAILLKEKLPLDQKFWIDKLNGGSVCQPTPGPPEYLPRVVDGNYTLPDGRKFKLTSHYYPGAPTSTDRLLVPLALGRPYILWWKQHAYVVTGALWNEYIYPNGQKQMEMKEISLLDPYVTGEKRKTKFVAGTDSSMDISGMMEVIVTPIEADSPWKQLAR